MEATLDSVFDPVSPQYISIISHFPSFLIILEKVVTMLMIPRA